MNKKILILIIVISSILFIPHVNAECNNTELNKAKSLASAIKFEKKYIGSVSEDEYGILISGMSDGFAVYYDNTVYFNNELISELKPKQTYTLDIVYNLNVECSMKMNYTRKITMPAYNKYHKNEICLSNEDIPYCSLTYDSSKMSEEKFVDMVNEYLDSQNAKPIDVKEDNRYIVYIIIGGIILLFIIVLVIVSKSKKKKAFL